MTAPPTSRHSCKTRRHEQRRRAQEPQTRHPCPILAVQLEQIERPQHRRFVVFAGMWLLKIADAELV
jgi:hypothetical protein